MKRTERDKAITLRKKGMSLSDISKTLNASKGSVSVWVRNVELTARQRDALNIKGFSIDAIEKRRKARIAGTLHRHRAVMNTAKLSIKELSRQELMLVGSALYWGEGAKNIRNGACVSNSDPDVIRIMMRFFKEILGVPAGKFRGHVHTFSHLNAQAAEKYWSKVSGIPLKQFYKTYSKPSVASLGKKDSLPYGTFQLSVCDTQVFLTIAGWIERLKELGR